MVEVRSPVEAEPAHVPFDRIDIFLLFLGRIGIIEAKMTTAAELFRDTEVEADRLGVTDVQVSIRLRRKARHHICVALGGKISRDDIADEVTPCVRLSDCCFRHAASPAQSRGLCAKSARTRQDLAPQNL